MADLPSQSPMLPLLLPLLAQPATAFETWCGKYYEVGSPRTPPPPESRFSYPTHGDQRLLDFKCATGSSIYLEGDDQLDPPFLVFDAEVTYDLGQPVSGDDGQMMNVSVYLDSNEFIKDVQVPIGSSGTLANFTLAELGLSPSTNASTITCTARHGGQEYTDTAELLYLPKNPHNGSSVKIDRQSGYLKVQYAAGQPWKTILPFGFYDSINTTETNGQGFSDSDNNTLPLPGPEDRNPIGELLWSNIQRLQFASRMNYTLMHPVPPGNSYRPNGNETAIDDYFDEAERLGLGVMYDMRHSWDNASLVQPQIEEFRNRKSLLVWYTADEPDGPVTPINATRETRDLIHSLDPYHPVTLVLNCGNHYWNEYSSGADILLLDPYPVAVNPTFSKKWSTEVTYDYGCSGCDECEGSLYDTSNRVDDYSNRARIMGKKREMPLWIVPQMFDDHGDEFWWRIPNGAEAAVQVVLAWNHGVKGHCAWIYTSASNDILLNASSIATVLREQTAFTIDAASTRRNVSTTIPNNGQNGLDVAAWTRTNQDGRTEHLILAAQLFYNPIGGATNSVFEFQLEGIQASVKEVLFGNVTSTDDGAPYFTMGRTSVAGVILEED